MDSKVEMDNPLASPQRESAGADSYDRFEYQYHWALCQAFTAYINTKEFAVFMEYHEDVIIADSLDREKVQFTFSQVKANASGSYTANSLTKRAKGSKGDKSSLLGKLCSSVHKKNYLGKVTALNFVSTVGFNFSPKDGLKLRTIGLSDLNSADLALITNALEEEVNEFDSFPKEILRFVYSDIPLQSYYEHTITRITDSVEVIFPKHLLKPKDIYRVLMDALRIRGKDTFDYDKWDEVLVRKALTYDDIHNVVTKGISGESSDLEAAKYIIDDLSVNALEKGKLVKELRAYSLRVLSPSLAMLESQKSIREVITNNRSEFDGDITYESLQKVMLRLPNKTSSLFESERSLIAAIIYEIVSSEI
ncbi:MULTISPECIES: DUF4297 domain-containing protein [Klebsiella]|uniref:DUF4297 domain-containing protein n=1 Tax=Klebsiella TaxID=570 RepID=UPI0015982DB0|nr:DUF4297 domain-containing protein [Klebsiella michiganensis]MDG9772164.1 DUF4297 domain-containing protein [Klebsiella michiganensis]MDH0948892.1 DUF4297 domain-containing protein [Klebsiella michiganensis]MDH1032109.1 DUF4297 domain-containing protein [Klebsiella michiganensis]MDH1832388.1 DUF4297 domain-containing protein [Klebsiella michiganensis]MDH1834919.1 DUF4297 domain-containing protein [Klebsiella michiganensis]